jgi:hypothetical protein
MESRMDFVYLKDKNTGGWEHSRMENYMEDHAGCMIFSMEIERHSNPSSMDIQLVSRENIAVKSIHTLPPLHTAEHI